MRQVTQPVERVKLKQPGNTTIKGRAVVPTSRLPGEPDDIDPPSAPPPPEEPTDTDAPVRSRVAVTIAALLITVGLGVWLMSSLYDRAQVKAKLSTDHGEGVVMAPTTGQSPTPTTTTPPMAATAASSAATMTAPSSTVDPAGALKTARPAQTSLARTADPVAPTPTAPTPPAATTQAPSPSSNNPQWF